MAMVYFSVIFEHELVRLTHAGPNSLLAAERKSAAAEAEML